MKRLFFAIAIAAIASIAVATTASADVARYQTQTATFTATQPYGQVGQFDNVWTHNFTVTVNPCDGTFTGTGEQLYPGGSHYLNETVTGSFSGGKVDLSVSREDTVKWSLTGAPTDNNTVTLATTSPTVPWNVEFKVSQPQFSDLSQYKNHGDYVSSMGGGADAAHSCIGMPINSSSSK